MDKYICKVCYTIYNPQIGDSEEGIAPNTPFENLPDSWTCPVCGTPKEKFEKLSAEQFEKIMNKKS